MEDISANDEGKKPELVDPISKQTSTLLWNQYEIWYDAAQIFSLQTLYRTILRKDFMNKKQKTIVAGLLCTFITGCGGGSGNQTSTPPQSQYTYTQPFDTSINIADSQNGKILGSAGYNTNISASGNNPEYNNFWSLMQWDNPENLMPTSSPPGIWQITNSWSYLRYYPELNSITNTYELTSRHVPCPPTGVTTTENNEFDLLFQPTQFNAPKIYISDIGQLELSIGLNFIYQNVQNICSVNRSGMVAALILTNADQSIFVQIDLGGTVSPTTTQPGWCPDYEGAVPSNLIKPEYKNLFCVDDNIANYGGSFMQAGDSKYITLDILPRLQQLLQSGHTKPSTPFGTSLHSNLNGWYITGYYFGTSNYGGTIVITQWYSPQIRSSGSASCANGATTRTQYVCETPVNLSAGWVNAGGGCYHRTSSVPC
jgi:hypothetical protein